METVKFALFFVMESAVVAMVGTVLVAGVYQIIRQRVQETRREKKLAVQPS